MAKIVYFHVGAGKTGSSAIQTALARNIEYLRLAGIEYPASTEIKQAINGGVTSGNASHLLKYMRRNSLKSSFDERKFEKYFSKQLDTSTPILLFSNELLHSEGEDKWNEIVRMVDREGAEARIVFYVRYIVDHAYSVYGQMVKRSGYSKTFSEYSKCYKCKFQESLSMFENLVGRENIVLRVYEEEKAELITRFGNLIGAPDFPKSDIEIVNRSLTQGELSALRHINSMGLDPGYVKSISDMLMNGRSASDDVSRIEKRDFENIKMNNIEVLNWINENYFSGKNVLRLCSSKMVVRDGVDDSTRREVEDIYEHIIKYIID